MIRLVAFAQNVGLGDYVGTQVTSSVVIVSKLTRKWRIGVEALVTTVETELVLRESRREVR